MREYALHRDIYKRFHIDEAYSSDLQHIEVCSVGSDNGVDLL